MAEEGRSSEIEGVEQDTGICDRAKTDGACMTSCTCTTNDSGFSGREEVRDQGKTSAT